MASNVTTRQDFFKFSCLVVVTLMCLGSMFTSQSIAMNNPSMRILTDRDVQQFCKEPRAAAIRDCKSDNSISNCSVLRQAAQDCENVLQGALRYINMGGCPHQIKSLTLCEDEWCRYGDRASCQKECDTVRTNLSTCVQETVLHYFRKKNLNDDGMAKV